MRVLLADDHATLRVALRGLLTSIPGFEVVGECENGAQALWQVERERPDLVLMDISMPVMDGIEATELIKERHPEVRVVALSGFDDTTKVSAMIAAGASGYLLKTAGPRELAEGLNAIVDGQQVLAPEVVEGVIGELARFYREERARAELLADVDRMKREFFALVSDDLRNPLAVITGYSRTMRRSWEQLDDETKGEFLDGIEQQAHRLARRVEQILTISGIRRAEVWEGAEFDLASAAREAAQRFADSPRLDFADLDHVLVRGDRTSVVTVCLSLIENALLHTTGAVMVRIEQGQDGLARLIVSDEGPGMGEERLERLIAGPFARMEEGPELDEGGSLGLSIYIARQLLEAVGGRMEAYSKPSGSSFSAVLPRVRSE
jgi:DNA-binding NarL/FixJ family response regulator